MISRLVCIATIACSLVVSMASVQAQETLPPLENGVAPQTVEELWADFDPRKEPLEVVVLKEWEEDDVVMQVLRFRIGIFKGQKSMMAAVYGYPKGGKGLPGLVQVHGGGQYAHSNAVLTNAKRGYATISLAWAGRIDAPNYRVTPSVMKLFWDGAINDPDYKLTTDWGALDGYHAPSKNPGNGSMDVDAKPWTLDATESPRNCPYFLWPLAARRALTFLERQPEVDAEMLAIYGHSMGGKITVLTAGIDKRVKAAAPSCGGISNTTANRLYQKTIADDAYLRRIACPIIFQSPSNDFHGHLSDLQTALKQIQTKQWRITCSPHHNHQDTKDYEVATQLWFDQHLKGSFTCPQSPTGSLRIETDSHVPTYTVTADRSLPILSVEIYYTQDGETNGSRTARINRFWHFAKAEQKGDHWIGRLPLESVDKPLWVYVNVSYRLKEPISGAGYYYRDYTTDSFTLSSRLSVASQAELQASEAQVSLKRSLNIESFEGDWRKQWFTYRPEQWGWRTHKIFNDLWKAPPNGTLAIDVRSSKPMWLKFGVDKHYAKVQLQDDGKWTSIQLKPVDFLNSDGEPLSDFVGAGELSITTDPVRNERRKSKRDTQTSADDSSFQGEPELRNLRWITTETTENS